MPGNRHHHHDALPRRHLRALHPHVDAWLCAGDDDRQDEELIEGIVLATMQFAIDN